MIKIKSSPHFFGKKLITKSINKIMFMNHFFFNKSSYNRLRIRNILISIHYQYVTEAMKRQMKCPNQALQKQFQKWPINNEVPTNLLNGGNTYQNQIRTDAGEAVHRQDSLWRFLNMAIDSQIKLLSFPIAYKILLRLMKALLQIVVCSSQK